MRTMTDPHKEIRVSFRLLRRLMRGNSLTRREHRQLQRTTKVRCGRGIGADGQDIFAAVPFLFLVIVPLGELLLPLIIKFVPGMMPSTFAKAYEQVRGIDPSPPTRAGGEEAQAPQSSARDGQAADRHDPRVGHRAVGQGPEQRGVPRLLPQGATRQRVPADPQVRATGESPTTDDIIRVAKLFDDDLTLDNLSRPQLVSLSRYMNVNAFGTDNFLRATIRTRMKRLREDDRVIDREGLDSLTDAELTHACQSRGIQTGGKSPDELRQELEQWIDLHIRQNLSGTLLFLGKAFSFIRRRYCRRG